MLQQASLTPARIGILGGSTTIELRKMLDLFLLAEGIKAEFYESGYNRYCDDVFFQNPELWKLRPDIVFIHTTWHNISQFPDVLETDEDVDAHILQEMRKYTSLWEKIRGELGAVIIQNNFDLPPLNPLGNLDASESFGRTNFLLRLNGEFAKYARTHSRFLINDILHLSTQLGVNTWFDPAYWYGFHMAVSPPATVTLAHSVAALVKSLYGKSKKCLVLDLDNTIWGGVIGDDGVQNLILGRDHPIGEAFVDFQSYVKSLQKRGVILAVCSKNEMEVARAGFSHPDNVLKLDDFSVFKANWRSKPENIRDIATELNIGLDSIVFVDDNPAERAFVAKALPEVAVPEIGEEVSNFATVIDRERYFEIQKVVREDIDRTEFYRSNIQRQSQVSAVDNYDDFLKSLEMTAEVAEFCPLYLERVTQLINKTNQFNLTTKRCTPSEVETFAADPSFITLYGRLTDKFGDNGLVSALVGRKLHDRLELDVWVMSCRVFKREMEFIMFDALVERCQSQGIKKIVGVYIPSKKNQVVAELYSTLGFIHAGHTSERQLWEFQVPEKYTQHAHFIKRAKPPAELRDQKVVAALTP